MNEYQGPEWAMWIITSRNLVVIPIGKDRFEIHRRRCNLTEPIPCLGWFASREVECFLMGYDVAMNQSVLERE